MRRCARPSTSSTPGLNRWETVKDVRILPRDLSVDEGELTPSLKIKRKVVENQVADLLETMYTKGGAPPLPPA